MNTDRRTFLATLGASALALKSRGLGALPSATRGNSHKLAKVGIQLYTVRGEMQKDVPATLERISKIGYREVEFAGYFGHSPAEIRGYLTRYGLTSPSSHVQFPDLGAGWAKSVDEAKAAGHQYVTVAWIDPKERGGGDMWRRTADTFNKAAEKAKAAGLRFAYHNHDFEFAKLEGEEQVPLDILLERTQKGLVDFEMDLYWVTKAGRDPIEYINRYPERFTMLHVKDATAAPERKMMDVGRGTIDFRKIFADAAAHGGHVKHYFVEHDEPADPFASAKTSYEYLAALEF